MWTYAVPVGSMLILLSIGFLILRYRLSYQHRKLEFANHYRERFIAYCNSSGSDQEAYTWLTLKSSRMQSEMGSQGIYSVFSPPGGRVTYSNYAIITNMLPELRRLIDENGQSLGTLLAATVDSYAKMIDEALLRYLGVLEERESNAVRSLRNPLLWLRTGVEQLLSTPLIILAWVGLVGSSAVWRLQGSYFFKMLASITTFIGLISGVITIILGWDQTVELVLGAWTELFE